MRYVITTPGNPQYNGVTFHVRFQGGRAVIDDYTLPNKPNFHPTLEELARMFKHDLPGYQVEAIVSSEPAAVIENEIGAPDDAAMGIFPPAPAKAKAKAKTPKTAAKKTSKKLPED